MSKILSPYNTWLHLSRIFGCLHLWQSFLGNPSWMYLKVKHHLTMCYGHYKTTAHHHSILGTMKISPKRMHAFNYYVGYDQSPLVQMTSNPPFDHWSISNTCRAIMDLVIHGNHNKDVVIHLLATSAHLVLMTHNSLSPKFPKQWPLLEKILWDSLQTRDKET